MKHYNIEIKEMPETSKVHRVESANHEKLQTATGKDTKSEKTSFMSQKHQPRIEDSPVINTKNGQFLGLGPENAKEARPINGQTGSTMNIKSFSGYDSVKDSAKHDELMSPGVEIQDINIPDVYNQPESMEDAMQEEDTRAAAVERHGLDFEKNIYKTAENYIREHDNPLYRPSNNSTMLMESIKDNQISGIWGRLTRQRRTIPAAAEPASKYSNPDA